MAESEIEKFYKDTNVLITGGTGFIGKLLIEKLLRSTDVSAIYLLIRDKKGKDLNTRLDETFDDVLFDRLKNEKPKFKHRINGISGDCSLPGLGLTIIDRQILIKNINIVIHAAATVRFDENLKLAYAINVNGTRDILELSKQMKGLKSIAHVSTAYSNCHLNEIHEKIYNYPITYENVEKLLEKLTKEEVNDLTPKLIGNWPNTYTFTKALAESLIGDLGKDLPIGIFRPGIIISTNKEPIEGWIDNFYGATGVVAAASSGLLKVFQCDKDVVANLVPADTCVAGILATAWDISNKFNEPKRNEQVPVYNYVSSVENPVTWGEFHMLNEIPARIFPSSKSVGAIQFLTVKNDTFYLFLRFLFHIIPAFVIDLIGLLSGQKPRLLKMYKKIHKLSAVLNFFSTRQWHYENQNTQQLWERMSDSDKKLFPMSITTFSWLRFFKPYVIGIRIHLLQDPLETLEYARVRDRRFRIIQNSIYVLLNFLLMVGLWLVITKLFGIIFSSNSSSLAYQSLATNNTCILSL